ncbi:YeeE/YedE family protein [Rheinheimera sp. MMS21-TC3]|uniref:YeeE/YedE family protein n=1 Tax=Rheinheimera sp. MMS21-TC3 TaxID=3072790 RepID=UPI0028C4709C|nr:YeeE/YedE thiosulfate transporter family protein [Rheinheimera sp. MMS21-TC3]WNO61962.1 YeeE/YedE thiosulfate transporter family protein [Rheinheimera sp. MMS21-TC3]
MENFTPISALIGGSLIGLGALMLFIFSGRIAGISGIASNLLFSAQQRGWRLAFVVGLIVGPLAFGLIKPDFAFTTVELGWPVIIAGLLVGLGTGWGSGCTSGHGICGMSRLSPRSILSTILFMLVGIIVATLLH